MIKIDKGILDYFYTTISIPHTKGMMKHGLRLDASFYDPKTLQAEKTLYQSGLKYDSLKNLAQIHRSNLRERTFVDSKNGIPLLTGRNLDTVSDYELKHVSKIFTRNIEFERLNKNDVLISCQGTVGKCDYIWHNHEGKLASEQIIRIRAYQNKVDSGFLFAYLSSSIAQSMILSQQAGSVINQISTVHLDRLPVPLVTGIIEKSVGDLIRSSFEARAEFRRFLEGVDDLIYVVNDLPRLKNEDALFLDPDRKIESATISSKDIFQSNIGTTEFRLDAHFYNPVAQLATHNLKKSGLKVRAVEQLTERVFFLNRFKRTFVNKEHGIPYLAGKEITQIRPVDLNYLSKTETTNLDQYRLKKGWILLTCSGTVGRSCFIWNNFEDYVGTHDLIRIVPNDHEIDNGYLYAFLSSKYGYEQIKRFKHGSVIDHITPEQVQKVYVPLPSRNDQEAIGNKVREAYEKRAEAIRLEDQAQEILLRTLTDTKSMEIA